MTVRVSPDGKFVVQRNGKALTIREVDDLPAQYTRLVTRDGRNTVLVDPDTGEGVAWIPTPDALRRAHDRRQDAAGASGRRPQPVSDRLASRRGGARRHARRARASESCAVSARLT